MMNFNAQLPYEKKVAGKWFATSLTRQKQGSSPCLSYICLSLT